jgi:hypothetical protein
VTAFTRRPLKFPLPNIERREQNLILAHRLEPDGLAPGLPARLPGVTEPEQIVLARAVDLDVVVPVVDARTG